MAEGKPFSKVDNGPASPRPRGLSWWWRALGLLMALFLLEQNVENLLYLAGMQPNRGTIGLVSTPVDAPDFGPG